LLAEIHGGECESHSSSRTLVGKAFWYGFYWPTALQDAAEMVKSCKACRFHAKQIHTPAQALQMIPPSWPFAVWDHSLGPSVGTGSSSSPSTSSQSGQRPPLWSTSPRVLLSLSSNRSSIDLESQVVSLRTTGPSLQVDSSRSIVRASAPSSALRPWLIQGAMAKWRGQMQKSSGDSRRAPTMLEKTWCQLGQRDSVSAMGELDHTQPSYQGDPILPGLRGQSMPSPRNHYGLSTGPGFR
jgi:hypothetical protein